MFSDLGMQGLNCINHAVVELLTTDSCLKFLRCSQAVLDVANAMSLWAPYADAIIHYTNA